MKEYILDSYAIQYLLESFPKKLMEDVWISFENSCKNGISISDKETYNELEHLLTEVSSLEWIKNNRKVFKPLKEKEALALGDLMDKGEFGFYKKSSEFMRRMPVASPFLVSMALVQKKPLVIHKSNRYRNHIEKLCKKHAIKVIGVEEFLLEIRYE